MTRDDGRMCLLRAQGHAGSSLEAAMRVCMWALSMHTLPTVSQIRTRWDVSRATAYRWRTALADALGSRA